MGPLLHSGLSPTVEAPAQGFLFSTHARARIIFLIRSLCRCDPPNERNKLCGLKPEKGGSKDENEIIAEEQDGRSGEGGSTKN